MSEPAPSAIAFLEPGDGYAAGACNIGPWEIRRRRTFAILAFVVAAGMLVALVAWGAPPAARLVLLLPLWGGMFSWLQARRRFCAAYAMSGLSNFGAGHASREAVADPAARDADRRAVMRLARDSFLLALVPTLIVVLLPL